MASYPTNDLQFSQWLGNFITVASANTAALRLTDGDIDRLTDIKETLDNRLTAEITAKEAALAATAAKASARRDANAQVGFRVNMIGANATVSDALKEQLGLNVRQKPSATAPAIPKDVFVEPFANGVNRLAWNGNGNISRTVYTVEQKVSQQGAWRIVGVATATKFDHANQTPGRHVMYRVKAKRGATETGASPEAVAYGDAPFPLTDTGA